MTFSREDIGHPKLRELYDFWERKRAGRFAPTRADIDPVELPRELIGSVFVYAVQRERPEAPPTTYLLKLFGTNLVDLVGRDLTGLTFDEIFVGPQRDAIRREYDHVATTGEPLCAVRDSGWSGRDYRRYHRLLLPLSEDGRTVDRLMGGAAGDDGTA